MCKEFSENYPLGGMLEPYDINREMEELKRLEREEEEKNWDEEKQ